jgi:hypothetical protein
VGVDDDRVATAWWEYQRLASGQRMDRKRLEDGEPVAVVAAVETVDASVARGGPDAVALIGALLRLASTEEDIALVGAGPLEDLLVEHGDDLAEQVAQEAHRNPQLASALGCVWWSPEAGDVVSRQLGRWLQERG